MLQSGTAVYKPAFNLQLRTLRRRERSARYVRVRLGKRFDKHTSVVALCDSRRAFLGLQRSPTTVVEQACCRLFRTAGVPDGCIEYTKQKPMLCYKYIRNLHSDIDWSNDPELSDCRSLWLART